MNPENRSQNVAAKLLGTNRILQLEPEEFDVDLLDHAKELGREFIRMVDETYWLIVHYVAKKIHFVQVQSPNKKIKYFTPKLAESMSFKEFLLAEDEPITWRLRTKHKR